MRRALLAVIVALSWPLISAAQSAQPRTEPSRVERPMALPVLPPIGLPLPPIGLPLPPIGLPPLTATPDASRTTVPPRNDSHGAPRGGERRRDAHPRGSFVYVVPGYGWPVASVAPPPVGTVVSTTESAPAPPSSTAGTVHFDIDAAGPVQLFVDGYYAGTLAELNNRLEGEPGPHHIELRAPGYEPFAADLRIPMARAIGYRAALTPSAPSAEPETPAPRSTIYFIPGCYLGNVHPRELDLPAGCDLKNLVIREP